jgi:HSP20 family protein
MLSLRSAMDRLFDNAFLGTSTEWSASALSLPLDMKETDDEYIVKASLPGLNPDDLEVTFNNGVLIIKGELKEEQETTEARWHLHERRYGSFARSVQVPTTVNSEAIRANFETGVLTLHLPKVEEVKPRKIQISRPEKMIEGKAQEIQAKN